MGAGQPSGASMKISFSVKELDNKKFPDKTVVNDIKYVVTDIYYIDRNLNKKYSENFTWKVATNKDLHELNPYDVEEFRAYKNLITSIENQSAKEDYNL